MPPEHEIFRYIAGYLHDRSSTMSYEEAMVRAKEAVADYLRTVHRLPKQPSEL